MNFPPARQKGPAPGQPIFSMSGITLRVRDSWILTDTNWTVRTGENWAVIGPNGAGKTTLMRAITGQVPVVTGKMRRHLPMASPDAVGYVSFEFEQRFVDLERARDEARCFANRTGDIRRGRDIVFPVRPEKKQPDRNIEPAIDALDIRHLLDREIRQLSSGELRRIFIARALLKTPSTDGKLLVLDEPFDGLDASRRRILGAALDTLMTQGIQIILVSHRVDEIPRKITRIIALKKGRVFGQGSRKSMLSSRHLTSLYGSAIGMIQAVPKQTAPVHASPHPVIDVRSATVRYGNTIVFKNLSWKVYPGEHWAISGPNGSGKTTLLRLVTGDHLQAYANEIYIFGRQRGTGESIWEIKRLFGVVSTELQRNYRKRIPALDVVRSGFFDSIGLYQTCTDTQRAIADDWINRLKLTGLMPRRYDLLSYGERKMVLIARAMVKSPAVLILDEPCQGLDPSNRRRVLAGVDHIAQTTDTQIVFVTHRPDEVPGCTTHWLTMPPPIRRDPTGG
ncbi:MAG: molybdate ABC transporter ATP-binding protein ModF [Deltaproteobacteria bacterium]|nr:MAG: molybdate ABC transporter ATP-binding protein ModF [Deltaproteobacteria bacterium]